MIILLAPRLNPRASFSFKMILSGVMRTMTGQKNMDVAVEAKQAGKKGVDQQLGTERSERKQEARKKQKQQQRRHDRALDVVLPEAFVILSTERRVGYVAKRLNE